MGEIIAIAAGGALGALSRACLYWIGSSIEIMGLQWGQIIANISGSFLAGICFAYFNAMSLEWRSFIVVGFLGSFTTMSAYAVDVQQLLAGKMHLSALFLWMTGAVICIVFAGLGFFIGQHFTQH